MTRRSQRTRGSQRPAGSERPETDEELACAVQAGSVVSFEELVYRYQDRIYRYLLRLTGDSHGAEDLSQETFIRAYGRIAQYKRGRPFGAWIFAIARNLAASRYRALVPTEEYRDEQRAETETPFSFLARREESRDLWEVARRNLPEAQFTALWLRYGDSMSIREIAGAMGKTGIHVKVLLHRARQGLAAKWSAAEERGARAASVSAREPVPAGVAGETRADLQAAYEGG